MMKRALYISGLSLILFLTASPVWASNQDEAKEELNAKEFITEHLADSYEWQIVSNGTKYIAIPLPVILHSKTTGWHLFPSSHFHHGANSYKGFEIAAEGKYKGKIMETDADGSASRPLDLSLTKNAASLLFASLLVILIIMGVAHSLKRDPMKPRKGFTGLIEMLVLSINDEVIKPSIGKDYQRYAPYLLTVFFFIFTNNLLGLIPLFPGGANVTGNIAVTLVLAVATFLIVNLTGTKEYYKEILWPDVPTWLKVPIPLMPIVEIVGTFTKPFALMIRLFANMMAGHSIVLGLTMLIFITASMGMAINTSMTVLSVIFTVFIDLVELFIAYIQAYVFTLLSAVFIGLARIESHFEKKKAVETEKAA
ncbi:F0F1 ATP synthase subunit A [Proteiniphilum saccharofermentans]|uniref:ATP synthase subunit a n=1 Tax=Proteiniphilum saccharofermentans TaxID=1642647 RepID=A0A1R3T2Q5_9BACT|nr:F0F1 ATP synthase subunit A [Proteiniphilum saccharofermentans]SCD20279.1 F0F1 ATP synthase subunit A [Proteiniphilum saccharofermentans]